MYAHECEFTKDRMPRLKIRPPQGGYTKKKQDKMQYMLRHLLDARRSCARSSHSEPARTATGARGIMTAPQRIVKTMHMQYTLARNPEYL